MKRSNCNLGGKDSKAPMAWTKLRETLAFVAGALLALHAWTSPTFAQSKGAVACQITENGARASGTMTVESGGRTVATGSCGRSVEVPPGSYQVALRLDGALDKPQQTERVTVSSGETATANANFATGLIEVRVTSQGRKAAALAIIMKGGERVGTLGSGVAAHLSTGTYDVVVKHRSQERRFDDVRLAAGQKQKLEAAF